MHGSCLLDMHHASDQDHVILVLSVQQQAGALMPCTDRFAVNVGLKKQIRCTQKQYGWWEVLKQLGFF